jgi:hypothetical protein
MEKSKSLITLSKGKLFIEWSIFFKRCEIINYYISYNNQTDHFELAVDDQDCDQSISLMVEAENIDKETGGFFSTVMGKQATRDALFQACYKMIRSHFITLVHIKVSFPAAVHLQCGDLISIDHEQKKFSGLISSIQHTISSTTAETKISFFCHKNTIKKSDIEKFIGKTLKHMVNSMHKEPDPFEDLKGVSSNCFVENISVFNTAIEQKNILERLELKDLGKVRACLKKHPTVVHVQFKDLRNNAIKEKTLHLIRENNDAIKK